MHYECVVVGLGSLLIGIGIDTLYRGYVKKNPPNGCIKVLENMLHMCVRLALMVIENTSVVSSVYIQR